MNIIIKNVPRQYLRNGNINLSGVSYISNTTSNNITYSDRRLKSNIQPLENRGELKPVTFIMNGKLGIGFIAQDVQELYPELVEDNGGYLSLNYPQLTAVLAILINDLYNKVNLLIENV